MGINVRVNQGTGHDCPRAQHHGRHRTQGTAPWQTQSLSLAVTAGQSHGIMLLWVIRTLTCGDLMMRGKWAPLKVLAPRTHRRLRWSGS